MASKYHNMPKLNFSATPASGGDGSGGSAAGGADASWVDAQRALKAITPLSRVHLTLEDGRAEGAAAVRYKLVVVDRRVKVRKKPLAAFIVPMGREHEWMFSSEEGQNQLTTDAGFSRLAIVTMQHGQAYESLEQVKAELSPLVPQLMPDEPTPGTIPFLSLGDDIGSVNVVYKGTSDFSGELFVEDVDGVDDEGTLRRLVFGSNRNLIQSEARLVAASAPVANPQDALVDQTYLSNQHHHSIVGAFSLLADRLMPASEAEHARAVSRRMPVQSPAHAHACAIAHARSPSWADTSAHVCTAVWCGNPAHCWAGRWLTCDVLARAFRDNGTGCRGAGRFHSQCS